MNNSEQIRKVKKQIVMSRSEINELKALRKALFGKHKFVEFSEHEKESKEYKRYNFLLKKSMLWVYFKTQQFYN
tara:strand:+ start:515 stop:736 length:222 start_codon:yes stop_codon:yes gene_type:complete